MAVKAAVDFRAEVGRLFDLFDRQAFGELTAMFSDDAQGVDEISRSWIRGKSSMQSYFDRLVEMEVADIDSTLSDIHVEHWDDVAIVTGVADQTYSVAGDSVAIRAPVSVLFRRESSGWKIALVHAVPLPEAD